MQQAGRAADGYLVAAFFAVAIARLVLADPLSLPHACLILSLSGCLAHRARRGARRAAAEAVPIPTR